MKRIPVAGPWITELEERYVLEAVREAWYDTAGVFHERFERAFAEHLGVARAMALPSATSGIHLSLAAAAIGPGDEVIVPESTWIATSAPISYVGATPVFVDVDPRTWCIDVASFEAAITPRTRAVIPVDLYGGVPEWDGLLDVARNHGVVVVEDAAEAIGALYHDRRAGSFGTTGIFSFHGSKTLTTGEGGLLVTDDDALFRRAQVLRDHGRQPGDTLFRNSEVAFKYKMSALQAALGLAQLERIDALIERKRQIFGWYQAALADLPGVALNAEPPGTRNGFWMVTAIVDAEYGKTKEDLLRALKEQDVDCRPFFYPLSSLDAYRELPASRDAADRNPVAYRLSATGVNLPSALRLSEGDVARACDAFRSALGLAARV